MSETNYVNPNGLPDDNQITSARDLAILTLALLHDFPQYSDYWHIPAIKYGRRIVRNYNPLLGRYPGADGMKTGFVCASGFNLVATAERDNKRFIAVVLGAPSSGERAVKAAELLQYGFNQGPLSFLKPSLGPVETLAPIDAAPPDLTDEMCGRHRRHPATEEDDPDADLGGVTSASGDSAPDNSADNGPKFSVVLSALRAPSPGNLLLDPGPVTPVVVYTGPTRTPDEIAKLEAQIAAEPVEEASQAKNRRRQDRRPSPAVTPPTKSRRSPQSTRPANPPNTSRQRQSSTAIGSTAKPQRCQEGLHHGPQCRRRRWQQARLPNSKPTLPPRRRRSRQPRKFANNSGAQCARMAASGQVRCAALRRRHALPASTAVLKSPAARGKACPPR